MTDVETANAAETMNNQTDAAKPGSAGFRVNPREQEFINAKAFMLKASTKTNLNLYDHLARVLTKVLDERPDNVVDVIEDISKDMKREKFVSKADTIQEKVDRSTEVQLAEMQKPLFERNTEEGEHEEEGDIETPLPNLPEIMYYFEQSGCGLNHEETVRVYLALKNLVDNHPLQTCRFWGKIFGIEQNYYIAEVDYREGEEEEEEEEGEGEENPEQATEKEEEDEGDEEEKEEDDVPKPDWKPAPPVKREDKGSGANKKTYFVCNEPGRPWVKLPLVTPQQLQVARKIRKFYTGRLDAPIVSYPPFPGNEANYLRAQVARISAGSQISPLGNFQFDEEEEEEAEEGEVRDSYVENPDFEGIPVRELIDPSLGNWVHHTAHILPQGRCVWENPVQPKEDDFEEEEDEEEKEEPDQPEPETGPPLLTPLSEDQEIEGLPPWTTKLSSNLVPQHSIAVIHSNLWPGSHAYGTSDKKFENLYIGWGLKYSGESYSPPPPPPIMEEFPSGPEITEAEDPTVEEEAALKAAQEQEQGEAEEPEDGSDMEDD